MADSDYREDGATSIISMLGSIVTALGYEITDNAKAAVTMLKMQKEILENASLRDFLTGNVTLKTIQNIATGAWYVPGKLIHFIQEYLASENGGGYPGSSYNTDYFWSIGNTNTYTNIPVDADTFFFTKIGLLNACKEHFNISESEPMAFTSDEYNTFHLVQVARLRMGGSSYYQNTASSGLSFLANIDGTIYSARLDKNTGNIEYSTKSSSRLNPSISTINTKYLENYGPFVRYTIDVFETYYGTNLGTARIIPGGGITRGGGVGRRHSLPQEESFPPCGGDTTVPEITQWSNRVINWNGECYMPLTYFKVNPSNENPGTEPGSPNTPIEPDDPRVDPETIIKYIYPNDEPQDTPQSGDNTVQTSGQLKNNYTNATNGPSDIPSTEVKSGLYTLWHPSADNLQMLGAFLYGGTAQGTIASIIGDPINAIIQLTEWAVTPVDGPSKSPVICNIAATDLKMPTIPNQFMQFDCGTVEIPREYHDFRDYEPYTRLSLFLPFVGDVNISTNDCITPHKIHVIYNIDFLSGVACAEVLVDDDVRYAYQAAMCAAIPVTSSDASRLLASLIGAAVGAVGGGVMGGIVGGTAGSRMVARSLIGGVSEAALSPINGIQTQRTGSISANTGLLGEMKPYVLVTRPISVVADQYKSLLGQPYQLDGTLGSQTGFVKVRELHLDGITATEAEKTEIEQLLKEGVIL